MGRRPKYHHFAVGGSALIPERFWNFGFTTESYPRSPGYYIIRLTRGVTEKEAAERSAGCKLIREIIGDIRGETIDYISDTEINEAKNLAEMEEVTGIL